MHTDTSITGTGSGMSRYPRYVLILMALSAAVRASCAALIEFGNDEVYYRLYALFPDWSHFDHPGMVGWMIQLFTLNLAWDSELAIRMASIVLGTVNIWLMYLPEETAAPAGRVPCCMSLPSMPRLSAVPLSCLIPLRQPSG